MQKVTKDKLPAHSMLHEYIQHGDFMDCYSCASDLSLEQATERAMEFPFWARGLLAMRNFIVAPLGLETDLSHKDSIGYFPIDKQNDDEVILGLNDKHLDFRISIMIVDNRVFAATWVHRHNWAGRIYLAAIMPFHILIMRHAIGKAAR